MNIVLNITLNYQIIIWITEMVEQYCVIVWQYVNSNIELVELGIDTKFSSIK